MAPMESTRIYLDRDQTKRLRAKAKANGTKIAEEVRRAVELYLSGMSADDVRLLDKGTRTAERQLREMTNDLHRVNARLDESFAQLSGSRAKH